MLNAIEALGFATAAALCGLLLVTHRPFHATGGGARPYGWLWVTGLLYAVAAFAAVSLDIAYPKGRAVDIAESIAWVSTCFGPLVFTSLGDPHVRSDQARKFLKVLAHVGSIALAIWFAIVLLRTDFRVGDTPFPSGAFYVSLFFAGACIVAAFAGSRASANKARPRIARWFAPAATLLALVQILATLVSIHDSLADGPLQQIASLISALWVLPWTLLLSFFLAQTRYADIALKRSLVLIASVCVAALVVAQIPAFVPGLPFVTATILVAALMLVAPAVFGWISHWVDRFLLRRPAYALVKGDFVQEARRASTDDELIALAEHTIREALRVKAAVRSGGDFAEAATYLARIRVGDRLVLDLAASKDSRVLMQEEFAFAEAIALELSYRLESLQLEAERRESRLREERLQRSLTEAKLTALRAQVDPHFLFNTLNTITDLIGRAPEQAETMTERLADCFRYALSRHDQMLSTLDEELQFVRRYLDIEQVRFGERLRVEMRNDETLGARQVPSLILQPIVENAVRHGLAPTPGGGVLSISAMRAGEYLKLEISDDGVGIPAGAPNRIGIGLRNVRERLQTVYRDRARMNIGRGACGRGTCITLLLPLHEN